MMTYQDSKGTQPSELWAEVQKTSAPGPETKSPPSDQHLGMLSNAESLCSGSDRALLSSHICRLCDLEKVI